MLLTSLVIYYKGQDMGPLVSNSTSAGLIWIRLVSSTFVHQWYSGVGTDVSVYWICHDKETCLNRIVFGAQMYWTQASLFNFCFPWYTWRAFDCSNSINIILTNRFGCSNSINIILRNKFNNDILKPQIYSFIVNGTCFWDKMSICS